MGQTSSATETLTSPETGEVLHRGERPFVVRYKDLSAVVALPGYYPAGDGDGVHVGDDMAVVDDALRALKERSDGIPRPETVRRIRRKLKLSQSAAGELFGGGPRAFDKYERALVEPSMAMGRLLLLAERRPDILDDLRMLLADRQPAAPSR